MGEYLIHYGVKGQKWGNRRYQYEDGSYTSAGKARYGIGPTGGASNLMRSNNAYQRHIGRVATSGVRPFHTMGRGIKNYSRSIKNAKGIKKVAALNGLGREANRANAANARDEAKISRDIAGSYKGTGLYSRYSRNSYNRQSDIFNAASKADESYANSRDRGRSVVRSTLNKYKAFATSDMRTITGKHSTVGKEIIKGALISAAGDVAVGVIRAKYADQ